MPRLGAVCLAAALLSATTAAYADIWLEPERAEYASANGVFRFTVDPGGKDADGRRAVCSGALDRKGADGWDRVWEAALADGAVPVRALVDDDGRFVATFGDWSRVGYGPHAVVVYGAEGSAIRSLSLLDLLTPAEIAELPTTVSSIVWGSGHRFEPERLVLRVAQVGDARTPADHEFFPVTLYLPDVRVIRGDADLAQIEAQRSRCAALRREPLSMRACAEANGSRTWCLLCARVGRGYVAPPG